MLPPKRSPSTQSDRLTAIPPEDRAIYVLPSVSGQIVKKHIVNEIEN